jgi:hypothetical protein
MKLFFEHRRRALAPFIILSVLFLPLGIPGIKAAEESPSATDAAAAALTGRIDSRTLSREPDPVVIQGEAIAGAQGLSVEGFRVFVHRDGETRPIPFDLNERDENGDYVQSELAYMAHDTGDRVSPSSLSGGWTKAFEIETTDPLNGQKGWAYLLHFAQDPPPKADEDYVSITEVDEPDPYTGKPYAVLEGKYFYGRSMKNSPIFYHFRGTKEAGYEEKTFSDHFSTRSRMKIMGFIPFKVDEESIWSETPAFYDGAARFIRRINLKIIVGKVKIPTGIVIDVTAYDRIANVPVKIKIPAVVKAISRDAWAAYGLDLNTEAAGKYTFYSNNHPEGIPITGKDDPEGKSFGFDKKKLSPSKDYWSIVAGPYGTFMLRHMTPPDLEERGVRLYSTFVDDLEKEYAPEYEKGQVGNHLSWLEVQHAPYGMMTMDSYAYYPPHFKYPEDVRTYLNILDHPIASAVTEIDGSGEGVALR